MHFYMAALTDNHDRPACAREDELAILHDHQDGVVQVDAAASAPSGIDSVRIANPMQSKMRGRAHSDRAFPAI